MTQHAPSTHSRTDSSADEMAALASSSGSLALDTEFMGEGRYRTLLCLVQIAAGDPSAPQCAIIDPLPDNGDFQALTDVFADRQIELVVHAGRQDIALIRRRFQTEPRRIFDTQIAAGFAGMPAQSSYESLLSEMLGVKLAKSASFTRWDTRPLSAEQLSYAREDVVHLLALADALKSRLAALGRLQWAEQECEQLEQANDERDLDLIFARLPKVRSLSASSRGVARELLEWRERTAADQDRTVQSILGDAVLIEIAKRKPTSLSQLEQIRGIGPGGVRRRGEAILAAIAQGLERPHAPLEQHRRPAQADAADAPLIALAEALVRSRGREAGLAYELIASRADLQAIVTAKRTGGQEANVRTLRGWRRELVGEELLQLLDGEISLAVKEGALQICAEPLRSRQGCA